MSPKEHFYANASYAAERQAFGDRFGGKEHGVTAGLARQLAEKHGVDVTIVVGKPQTIASHHYVQGKVITLGQYAGVPVVLHELAHAVAAAEGHPRGHGANWQRAYLRLVHAEMGDYWCRRLVVGFEDYQPRGWRDVCAWARAVLLAQSSELL